MTHVHAGTRRARLGPPVSRQEIPPVEQPAHVKESSKATLAAHQQAHTLTTSKLDWHLGMGGAVMAAGLRGGRRTQRETTDFGILSAGHFFISLGTNIPCKGDMYRCCATHGHVFDASATSGDRGSL